MFIKKRLSFFLILLVIFVCSIPSFAVIDYPNFVSYLPSEEYPYFIEFEYWEGTTISDSRYKAHRFVVFFEDIEGLVFPLEELTMLPSYGGGTSYAIPIRHHENIDYLLDRNYRCYRATSWNMSQQVYYPYELIYDKETQPHTGSTWYIIPSEILRCNFDIEMESGVVIPGEHPADYYIVDEVGYFSSEQKYQLLEWEKRWEQNLNSQFFIYISDISNDSNAEQLIYNFMRSKSPSGHGTICLFFYFDEGVGKWTGYFAHSARFVMQLPDQSHISWLTILRNAKSQSVYLYSFILNFVDFQYKSILYDNLEFGIVDWFDSRSIWSYKYRAFNFSSFLRTLYYDSDVSEWLLRSSNLDDIFQPNSLLFPAWSSFRELNPLYRSDAYAFDCPNDEHDNHIYKFLVDYDDRPFVFPSPAPDPTPVFPVIPDSPVILPTPNPYDDTDWRIPDIDVPNFMDLIYRKFPIKTFERTWDALNRDYERLPPSFTINLRELAESAGATGSSLYAFPDEDIELADWTLFSVSFLDVTILEFLRLLISTIMIWKTFGFVYTEFTDNIF